VVARTMRASFDRLLLAGVAMFAFIAATNKWVSWSVAIQQYRQTDEINYRAMAAAAPGLLHHRIVEWHAERWVPQWIAGSAAKLFHISLEASYRVMNAVLILAICLVLIGLLVRLRLSLPAGVVCLALLVLSAYTLRPYLMGPGGSDDLVFVLGVTIAARGLALRDPVSLIGGLLIATLGRQTAVPAALVAAVVVALDPAWRERLGTRRLATAAAVALLPVACYVVIRLVAAPFAEPSPSLQTVTLLGASLSPGLLVQHFARCVNGLLAVAALIGGVWWVRRRGGERKTVLREPSTPRAKAAAYACLAVGASIVIQPVLLNPKWASYNETRLAVLGVVPLIVALALMLRELERARAGSLSPRVAATVVGLLALGSLHHIYTVIGGSNKAETLVLQGAVAVALFAIAFRFSRPRAAAG
jgi:hypothetical protein